MLYVGTSGWQYDSWKGRFYPQEMPTSGWLRYYCERFATVEVNNTFYRLPERRTFEKWRRETPDDFVVTVKANRYLTHLKRLIEPEPIVKTLMEAAAGLGPKLGPVLLQLPPKFPVNVDRLRETLAAFPAGVRLAVEFRHSTWFSDEVRKVLEHRDAAFCLADRNAQVLGADWRTSSWGYLRMHEGNGDPHPCYPDEVMARWADKLASQFGPSDDVYVYFNNDGRCCAIRDAIRFAGMAADRGFQVTRAVADPVPVP
ncbi:MAG TPA: DUF72 domain-containing protein [Actinomycetota bacterium]|nr:DUF72 domain-containing protein [Actinomycetota bacterium]